MQIIVQLRHARIVAIHRQQVLGKIVRADREKFHPSGKGLCLIDRRGDLNHHADTRHGHGEPLVHQLVMRTTYEHLQLVHLAHRRYHGQHDLQVTQADGSTQHGADLGQKDLRMVEQDPHTTPAEEGIGLGHGKIGQRLVAADVERA